MADLPRACSDWEAALAVRALDAQDGPEEAALAQHLQGCAACRAHLDELEAAADALAFAAPAAAPGPGVRERLLRRASPAAPMPVRLHGEKRRWAPGPRAWGLAAAAALLLVTNAAGVTVALNQRAALERQEARIADLEQRVRAPQVPRAAATAQVVSLQGTAEAPGAHGELAYDPASGRAAILLHGLPPAAAGKAYQSWLRQGPGVWISIGLLETGANGEGLMIITLPATLAAYDGYWLSLEPVGGSPRPSGPRIITAKISA